MNQPVDTLFNLDKRAKAYNSDNLALNYVADFISVENGIPRLGLKLLITDGNSFCFRVDFQNLKLVIFADFKNFGAIFAA